MIDINKHNYEEYFIDFLDGNLSPSDQGLLMAFLDQNKDLKKELESYEKIEIFEKNLTYKNKGSLKKNLLLEDLNNSNFEELCIAQIESDLREKESQEFLKFIAENEKLEKEYKLFTRTKLQPDYSIKYENKNELKAKQRKLIYLQSRYSIISIAASVILIIGLYFLIPKQEKFTKVNEKKIIALENNVANNSKKDTNIKGKTKEDNTSRKKIINNTKTDINNNLTKEKIKTIDKEDTTIKADNIIIKEPNLMAYLIPENNKIQIPKINPEIITDNILVEYSIEMEKESKEYLNIKSFIVQSINNRILKKGKKNTIEFFDIAQAGVEGINKITKGNMSLERVYDEKGNPQKTQFSSRIIAFSTPIKNN